MNSSLRRMIWVFPDRESQRGVPMYQKEFWNAYVLVAEKLGLTWELTPPEAIAVDGWDPSNLRVFANGTPATVEDTLFVTSLYSLPYQAMDVFNQFSIYAVLEQAKFYLPHPPYLSAIVNDKLATILHLNECPIPPIPTVRIGTGRDLGHRTYEPVLEQITYPAILKPVGWCAGWGVCLARDVEDLRGLLSLAQGGDTAMVAQPYLGPGTTDYRVFCVDGEPLAVQRRMPREGGYVGNVGRGGTRDYVPIPDELRESIAYVTKKVPIPFLCVDFLYDGERFWLSEIEPDGVIGAHGATEGPLIELQHNVITARFRAYQRGHAQWIGQ